MEIVSKVLGILDAMVTAGEIEVRLYQNAGKANVQIDFEQTPAAIMYCVSKWNVDLSLGVVRERAAVGIGFVKRQSELDFSGVANETLVNDCKGIAMKFVKRLKEDGGLTIEDGELNLTTIYDQYDTNVTGVWLDINLRDNGGTCLANA